MLFGELTNQIKKILSEKKSEGLQDIIDLLQKNINHYSWVGIYRIKGDKLILGPWKGIKATEHTVIPISQGICGSAAASGKTEIVDDVNEDNRYLSCFITTKSEIVVPIKRKGITIGEIDIDSDYKNAFTIKDKKFLEKIADMLSEHI